jgi:hypothetical protein
VRWRFSEKNTGRVLECGIYRTHDGLQVRSGFGPTEVLRVEHAAFVWSARLTASAWKQAVIDNGRFEEMVIAE